jgi:hypothetical protein
MSFKVVEQCRPRLNRSELAVPGSSPSLFEKAANSPVDVIFLDLEDAVAPDQKEEARKNIIQAIDDIDWGSKTLSVRINGLDTRWMYRDVVDLLERRRTAGRDYDPQGWHGRRRLCRGYAGHPDRGGEVAKEASWLRVAHRNCAGNGE